jgi:hypothetical protein
LIVNDMSREKMVVPDTLKLSWFHRPSIPVPITLADGSVTVIWVPGDGLAAEHSA